MSKIGTRNGKSFDGRGKPFDSEYRTNLTGNLATSLAPWLIAQHQKYSAEVVYVDEASTLTEDQIDYLNERIEDACRG